MRAEQSTSSAFFSDAGESAAEIELTIGMEIPRSGPLASGDVSTWLRYEPKVPERLQDELHSALYNGVHAGLALVNDPLPEGGIGVEITRLVVKRPQLETLKIDDDIGQVAASLHSLAAYAVASLWQGLSNWRDASPH
jgi:hypothetical protein